MTEYIIMFVVNLVAPKATAKHELLFNKPVLEARLLNIEVGLKQQKKCDKCDRIHNNDCYEFGHT